MEDLFDHIKASPDRNCHYSSHFSPFLPSKACPAPEPLPPVLDPTSASLLLDMRFLTETIINLPDEPSPWQVHKLNSMMNWISNRVMGDDAEQELKPESPEMANIRSVKLLERSIQKSKHAFRREEQSTTPETSSPASETLDSPTSLQPQVVTPPNLPEVIKLTARLYIEAIRTRQPLSSAIRPIDVQKLSDLVWRVPLDVWKTLLGVSLWVMLAILPTARRMPRFFVAKSMVMVATLQTALGSPEAAVELLRTAVKLQQWLCKVQHGSA